MAKKSKFEDVSSISLKDHLALCRGFVEFNEAEMEKLSLASVRYYKGAAQERANLRHLQSIESRWYKSVSKGKPDYSVYSSPGMVAEMWACWRVYSRGYLLSLEKLADKLPKVSGIVDLGCGTGLTTAALSLMFPKADVVGTNISTSFQYDVASLMGSIHGFNMAENAGSHADLAFASEYFEHHERPLEHLAEIALSCAPRVMVVANSFNSTSVGHFPEYKDGGKTVPAGAVGRLFNSRLRDLGYVMLKTGLWNNRPTFWVKQ